MIKSDYKAFNMTFVSLIKGLFTGHTFYSVLIYRIGNFLARKHIPFIPNVCTGINLHFFGCHISSYATIGKALRIYHSVGIVIGHDCIIGDNCEIFQNVTIGENRKECVGRKMPKIGNNCSIYSGAVLAGTIEIGDNCSVAANSVVLNSFEDNLLIGGIPAKVLRKKEDVQ